MLTNKITCPHCSATLRSGNTDLAGRRIKCQKCGQKFVAGQLPLAENGSQRGEPERVFSSDTGFPTRELPAMDSHLIAKLSPPKNGNIQVAAPFSPPPGNGSGTPKTGAALASIPFAPPTESRPNRSLLPWILASICFLVLGVGGAFGIFYVLNQPNREEPPTQANANLIESVPPGNNIDPLPPEPKNEETSKPEEQSDRDKRPKESPKEPASGTNSNPPGSTETKDNTGGTNPAKPPVNPPVPPINPPPETKIDNPKKSEYHTGLTPDNQKRVDDAIDRGVQFLKRSQRPDGSWGANQHAVGYAALPALTLLECGVPPNDPVIERAAGFIRQKTHSLNGTYELSLVILFLDKLGNKNDQNLIRNLATRLIAGQQQSGGWTYTCPLPNNKETYDLVTFLHKIRPDPFIIPGVGENPLVPLGKDSSGKDTVPLPGNKGNDPLIPVGGKSDNPTVPDKKGTGIVLPFQEGSNPPKDLKKEPMKPGSGQNNPTKPVANNPPPEPFFKPFNINTLSPAVQKLAVVKSQPIPKWMRSKVPLPKAGANDNSNTQFAMMALWVARRYNVPVEKTMALVDQRFLTSQHQDGGWGYQYNLTGTTPSMTCVGLIGLAVGHGSYKESLGADWKKVATQSAKQDPNIQGGLAALHKYIGVAPNNWDQKVPLKNLYFLWSVERVAMLYNLKTIGNKDWYNWAAQMLVVNQQPDGQWGLCEHYHGQSPTLNTCLSLLILKRANFVPDLTESLKEYIPIKDPGAGNP